MGIAALYISDFPAWVQQQLHEQQCIAVYDHERIIARSKALRRKGLERGEPLHRARELYPEAVFFKREAHVERTFWKEVCARTYQVTPYLTSLEPGWLLCRPIDVRAFGDLLKQLDAQGGISDERPIAQLAALRAHPGHLLDISEKHQNRFLKETEVTYLERIGFSSDATERLQLFGFTTTYQIASLSERHLNAQFGTEGQKLYHFFHPEPAMEAIPEYQPPATIRQTFDFERPATEPGELTPVLERLIDQALNRLGRRECQRIRVRIYEETGQTPLIMTRLLTEPTGNRNSILQGGRSQLSALLKKRPIVRRIEIELAGLSYPEGEQANLFFHRPSIQQVLHNLSRRFPGKIFQSVLDHPNAFLPERAARLKPITADGLHDS